jgi:hypothetical protein
VLVVLVKLIQIGEAQQPVLILYSQQLHLPVAVKVVLKV